MKKQRYKIKEIAEIVNAQLIKGKEDKSIHHLVFDSRKLESPQHSLFFALKGSRDGHDFLNDAYAHGIRNFVIDKKGRDIFPFSDANFLLVDDVLQALQSLAAHHRAQFDYPVIAIAGSNGKTIVKDWLNQLLSDDYSIVRSPKSFNSQIGVALSLWQMSDEHKLAIIEAGISKPGEMEALRKMIRPTIGVLTNVKEAHYENFENKEEKIKEKLALFKEVDLLIYSPLYVPQEYNEGLSCKTFTWGNTPNCDLYLVDRVKTTSGGQRLSGLYMGERYEIEIPFQDEASIENSIICWSTLLVMGLSKETIARRMKVLAPIRMRLELKNGLNNCSIIDDSYSCDVSSLTIALDFLQQQNQHQKRTLILSDIPEIGKDKEAVYRRVAELLANKGIEQFIGIGDEIGAHSALFNQQSLFFSDTETFLRQLHDLNFQDETILIKGARKFQFEMISQALSLKIHETALEINLNALENNLKFYKGQLRAKTKIMVMVKAFSYGSGSFEIANLLQFNQVDYLAVAYADEGITLRNAGITLPIMVMSPDLSSLGTLVDHGLEPEIFSFEQLNALIEELEKRAIQGYPIHFKLDTGMHRLGFNPGDLAEIISLVNANGSVKIASVFSHFAGADDPAHDDFSRQQLATLSSFAAKLSAALNYSFLTHIANTAGMIRFPDAQLDMVRLGIGLYGIKSFATQAFQLDTVATLKTVVSQVKEIPDKETIGYGRKGTLEGKGTIATVKIGYADGYIRRFGNGVGRLMVNGILVPTVGNICMDMCMIDVSEVDVTEGDEVIVFGENPRIEELAEAIGTIPYEVLTGISQRVKRVYFYE